MHEPNERLKEIEDEIADFQADLDVMESPLWERMERIFRLRREFLMACVMNNEDETPQKVNQLKGMFKEAEYYLTLTKKLRGGMANAVNEFQELEQHIELIEEEQLAGETLL